MKGRWKYLFQILGQHQTTDTWKSAYETPGLFAFTSVTA